MAVRVAALIAAGGSSTRMGQVAEPYGSKLLVPLCGTSVLKRTIEVFSSCSEISSIVIVARGEIVQLIEEMVASSSQSIKVVEGGPSRQASVFNGLKSLLSDPPDYVVVHDAARCLVSAGLISRTLSACKESRAVTAAVKINDTLKLVSNGVIDGVLSRERVWAIQTPQAFEFEVLMEGHQRAEKLEFMEATDDASLVSEICPVSIVPGEPGNIKITTPSDLEFAEALLKVLDGAPAVNN